MATFDFLVDTKPMAETVATVSSHVNATTAAVTAMQAAVIKSEKDAADKICDNVDRGFYSLIRSQISMKLAGHYNEMTAKLALLVEFAKTLNSTQERMESDFNRLKREYYKVFHSIDKSLENRIYQLDKSAMQLADNRKNLITGKLLRDAVETVCVNNDSNNTANMVTAARLKSKASRALACVGENVNENENYKGQLNNMLETQYVENMYEECVPVVIIKEQSLVAANSGVSQMFFPDAMPQITKSSIETKMVGELENLSGQMQNGMLDEQVRANFYNYVNNSGLDQRTAQTMVGLFENGR